MKIGIGYDIHKLKKESESINGFIYLCGVRINSNRDVIAHSDGDVAIHALVDSILGASCNGDIGDHFPPTIDKFRDINSSFFLEEVLKMIVKDGMSISNIDMTIVCKSPNFSAYKSEMRDNICRILNLDTSRFNIKAKSSNGVNAEGCGDAISSFVSVLLKEYND